MRQRNNDSMNSEVIYTVCLYGHLSFHFFILSPFLQPSNNRLKILIGELTADSPHWHVSGLSRWYGLEHVREHNWPVDKIKSHVRKRYHNK